MAINKTATNRSRVEEALEALRAALVPLFERVITARHNAQAWTYAVEGSDRYSAGEHIDLTRLFNIFHTYRDDFKDIFDRGTMNFVHEAQGIRNQWAHQEQFSTADALRALDTIGRILEKANAPQLLDQVQVSHQQLLRSLFTEQARSETRKITRTLNSQGDASLVPWREIAMPHEDVRTGKLKEAEFAADLDQVHRQLAGPEYQDPQEFFGRTYLTEGLTTLISSALRRLLGQGGDPVLELQTNFGGGKTHSMIALYHLASGTDLRKLPGLEPLLAEVGYTDPLFVQRAVLVGTKLSVSEPRRHATGVVTRTLWGNLAYQLAGTDGYRLVEESDRNGLAPGAEVLQEVFELAGPSLILIDEWVAFVRHLYQTGSTPPAAGSFDANLTFAQALTEAVTNTPGVLLAASLPSSELEVGGEGGKAALATLRHTFSRVKASWRAASSNEGFEIVRRRLFQEITDHRRRDATIKLFMDMYQTGGTQFPTKSQEVDYRKRMEAAYPFHPETFDQLFDVWGSLETFQRTRGVLRLMANVVHTLWDRNDSYPLIMPGNIPLDAVGVITEMGGYLPDSWSAVIEHDIDGDHALSLTLDRENSNYDRMSATRRVARTIFLGSAPTFRSENRGIDDRSIRLGVAQPGESVAIFGDALRQFADRATYLYSEHGRYWFSTQPSVTQIAQERLDQLPDDDKDHAIVDLLRAHQAQRGLFDRVHVAPQGTADIVDTPEASLVILGPHHPHVRGQHDPGPGTASPAIMASANILDTRGDGRRQHRNGILFLAPDRGRLDDLRKAVAQQIVWGGINDSHESLNLDAQQLRQAKSRLEEANRTVDARLRETWQWLLAPYADAEPQSSVRWEARQIKPGRDDESLPQATSTRAESEGFLVTRLGGSILRQEIDKIPSFRAGWTHISIRDLAAWFSNYLYLPRIRNTSVLEAAIGDGLRSMVWEHESFAYVDAFDEAANRYRGLRTGFNETIHVQMSGQAVLVHPDVARKQFRADEEERRRRESGDEYGKDGGTAGGNGVRDEGGTDGGGTIVQPPIDPPPGPAPTPNPTRYFGAVTLNPQTMASQVSEISRELVSHLQGIYGANVRVSLEIEVDVPDGIPADRQDAVRRTSDALRFEQSDFAGE